MAAEPVSDPSPTLQEVRPHGGALAPRGVRAPKPLMRRMVQGVTPPTLAPFPFPASGLAAHGLTQLGGASLSAVPPLAVTTAISWTFLWRSVSILPVVRFVR